MDCWIIDSKIVLRAGSLVSVPPNHFGDNNCKDRYFGIVLHLTQDHHKPCVKWFEDDTISIEDLVLLTLNVKVPKKPKFTHRMKPNPETLCDTENIDFTPTVNLEKDSDWGRLIDSWTFQAKKTNTTQKLQRRWRCWKWQWHWER